MTYNGRYQQQQPQWACPACTLLNLVTAPVCEACGQANPVTGDTAYTTAAYHQASAPPGPPPPVAQAYTHPHYQQQQQQQPQASHRPYASPGPQWDTFSSPNVTSPPPQPTQQQPQPPETTTTTSTSPTNPHTSRQLKGAAAAGGIAGLVLGGPVLAAMAAGGAAYAVTSKGEAGHVTRQCGDAVANVGVGLKRFNRKHHVVETTTTQVTKGMNWAAKRLEPKK